MITIFDTDTKAEKRNFIYERLNHTQLNKMNKMRVLLTSMNILSLSKKIKEQSCLKSYIFAKVKKNE